MRLKFWLAQVLVLLAIALPLHAANTTVRFVLDAQQARAGDTVMAAFEMEMAPQWHTYWVNPGASGAPTRIQWELPEGVTAGAIQWPVPEKYVVSDLTTYVYHNRSVLLVPLTLGKDLAAGELTLKAKLNWLECAEVCIPARTEVSATLTIGSELKAANAEVFTLAKQRLPRPADKEIVTATWEGAAQGENRSLAITWKEGTPPMDWDFFPFKGEDYQVADKTESLGFSIRKQVSKDGDAWPKEVVGLITWKEASGAVTAYEVKLPITEAGSGAAAAIGQAAPASENKESLAAMLVFAFIGGLILNIMPCVLPVIALKILGFVNQSKEAPARVRQLGLVYGLGVLVSFLALAAIAIGVQQAGGLASWGMAFQNPTFRVVITILVTLVALNLFGIFEITLSGRAMGAAGDLASREGAPGAFFNGVLATVLATPCTAPFLGAALGFAFTQPPLIIILMFLAVGAGLAAPFVILCWQPGWLKFLPKPGAWMEKFKIAMGFPMLATALWLFSLTAPSFGKPGVLWFGLFLVMLALAVWVWGEFVQRGRARRGLGMVASLAILAVGSSLAFTSLKADKGAIQWAEWSPEAVKQARAKGVPVLVDFTADWCLTCQLNKKTSLEIADTRAKLREINAVALLGDYTDQDDRITEELKRFARRGVPLVIIYPADANATPIVLPEVLTPQLVLDALDKASSKTRASR